VDVILSPALRYLRRPGGPAVDLVLLDPPYVLGDDDLAEHLAALAASGRLAPGAVVVVERSGRSPGPRWPDGLQPERERRYGETAVWIAVQTSAQTVE
jgi:16S rRNA (guanine966-N2)-methyltransferase